MGRIEDALRRNAEQAPPDESRVPTVVNAPATDVFVSPWTFAGNEAPGQAPEVVGDSPPLLEPALGGVTRGFTPRTAEKLVTSATAGHMAEQFRRLAATLHHAQVVQGTKVLMVTSAQAGDGKSFTATNLALTLSESYRREVLLVDADLRRPTLHDIFSTPNVTGLNEGLKAGNDTRLNTIKLTASLTLLPAGRPDPDPMGGLSSPRMQHILQEAAARFDWVIVDTAPVGLLADGHILATMVDGALLVIRANITPHAAVARAVDVLGRDRILGVVLNDVENVDAEVDYSRYGPPSAAQRT